MHGSDEAREGHLLELVVDEVADGVGESEAGGSGCEGGPVDLDGHDMVCVLGRRGGGVALELGVREELVAGMGLSPDGYIR